MAKYGVRNSFLFPTALKMMMKAVPRPKERFDLRLRTIMSAGEAVGTTVFDWARDALGVTINEMFGQTEMNYIVGNSQRVWPVKPGSMGRPYPGHRIAVIGAAGHEVPAGTVGDVAVNRYWIDGTPDPVFVLGYWKNPEATARKFSGDWGRTGDEALADEDGYLWYQARDDDVITSGAYRIGPGEIEDCLLRHPAVAMAAVVGIPDPIRTQAIKAFVVLVSGATGDETLTTDLQGFVRERLGAHEYPRASSLLRSVLSRYPEERELHERVRLYLNVCERHMAPRGASPATPEERVFAATLAVNAANFDDALAHLRAATAELPEHDHALYMLASVLAQRDQVEEAVPILLRAIELNPDNRSLARHDPELEVLRQFDSVRAALEAPAPAKAAATDRRKAARRR
jgi:hypothetical protein